MEGKQDSKDVYEDVAVDPSLLNDSGAVQLPDSRNKPPVSGTYAIEASQYYNDYDGQSDALMNAMSPATPTKTDPGEFFNYNSSSDPNVQDRVLARQPSNNGFERGHQYVQYTNYDGSVGTYYPEAYHAAATRGFEPYSAHPCDTEIMNNNIYPRYGDYLPAHNTSTQAIYPAYGSPGELAYQAASPQASTLPRFVAYNFEQPANDFTSVNPRQRTTGEVVGFDQTIIAHGVTRTATARQRATNNETIIAHGVPRPSAYKGNCQVTREEMLAVRPDQAVQINKKFDRPGTNRILISTYRECTINDMERDAINDIRRTRGERLIRVRQPRESQFSPDWRKKADNNHSRDEGDLQQLAHAASIMPRAPSSGFESRINDSLRSDMATFSRALPDSELNQNQQSTSAGSSIPSTLSHSGLDQNQHPTSADLTTQSILEDTIIVNGITIPRIRDGSPYHPHGEYATRRSYILRHEALALVSAGLRNESVDKINEKFDKPSTNKKSLHTEFRMFQITRREFDAINIGREGTSTPQLVAAPRKYPELWNA